MAFLNSKNNTFVRTILWTIIPYDSYGGGFFLSFTEIRDFLNFSEFTVLEGRRNEVLFVFSLFSLFFLWKFLFIHDIFNDIFVNLFLSLSELFLYLSLVIISSANNRFRIIGFDENWLFQFSLQLANYFSLHQPTRFGRFWCNTDWFLWFLIDFFYIFSIISEIDSQSIKKIVFFQSFWQMIGAFWPIILRDDWRFFFRDQYYVSITFLAVLACK